MRSLLLLSIFCLLAVAISAKKQIEDNTDSIEGETKSHSHKKYSKEFQKHQHNHKHKKQHVVPEEEPIKVEPPTPKKSPVDIPETEVKLQSNLETSHKAIKEQHHKEQVEDLHLQDLAYEESLKKDKKKKNHHAIDPHAETADGATKKEGKLFADHKHKAVAEEKVIEDSFQPLESSNTPKSKKNGKKDKKQQKNKKKAHDKNKNKNGKNKYSKKNNKKDKKSKNQKY